MSILGFCHFTIRVCLFPIQGLQILPKPKLIILKILNLSVVSVSKLLLEIFSGLKLCSLLLLDELKDFFMLNVLKSLYISIRLYFPPKLLVLSSSFDT